MLQKGMLEKVKKHLVDCGFDIMRDFLKEGEMTKMEFVCMSEGLSNSMYLVDSISDWEDLLDCLRRDDLGVLGYVCLDDIMNELDC